MGAESVTDWAFTPALSTVAGGPEGRGEATNSHLADGEAGCALAKRSVTFT